MTETGKHRSGVLLINPPFSQSRGPIVAIPKLAAYLESRGIPVKAWDLGAGFMKRFLTPKAISEGAECAKERFLELNGETDLGMSQRIEYSILLRVLKEFSSRTGMVQWFSTPFADFQDIRDSDAYGFLMLLASMRYFPEIFILDHKFINPSRFSSASSREILLSTLDDTHYTRLFREEIERVWPEEPPRVVGFSIVFTHQIVPAFQMAAMVKKMDSGVHITMGGPAISLFFRDVENPEIFNFVDSLVMDDGEIPLVSLYHEAGKTPANFHDIPGVISIKNGRVHRSPPGKFLPMMDLPVPNLRLFDCDDYLLPEEKIFFPLVINRGCSWQKCAFCRTRHPLCRDLEEPDPDQVFERMRQIHHEQGIANFFFTTESADPISLERISQRIIQEKLQVQWMTHTRVAKELTRDRCELFVKAGCRSMALGVESLSDRILLLMKKGITEKLVHKVLGDIGNVMPLSVYMMIGFPTETRQEAMASYEAVKKFKTSGLISSFTYSMFIINHDSEIQGNPSAFGITRLHHDPDEDLKPDIAGFSGPGMGREEAFGLCMDFVREQAYPGISFEQLRHIVIDGERIAITHDTQKLRQATKSLWGALVLPFGKLVSQL